MGVKPDRWFNFLSPDSSYISLSVFSATEQKGPVVSIPNNRISSSKVFSISIFAFIFISASIYPSQKGCVLFQPLSNSSILLLSGDSP